MNTIDKKVFFLYIYSLLLISEYKAGKPIYELNDKKTGSLPGIYSKLPMLFRKNMGQWDDYTLLGQNKILYKGSSPGWNANVYFMKDHLSFGFKRTDEKHESDQGNNSMQGEGDEKKDELLVWNMWFKEVNPNVIISAEGEQSSRTNYLLGNDPSKYCTNVPDYNLIKYQNLYENIDLRYYSSNGKELKYDFVVNKGGNLNNIQLACEGIKKASINKEGNLIIHTLWGDLIEQIPESYQSINGQKNKIKVSYKIINDTTVGFVCHQNYNRSYPLVIDPVNLAWSTFLGGTGAANSYMGDIALDAAGNVYGITYDDSNFPTTAGAYQTGLNGPVDAVVFKLNPNGTALIYCTNLGGSGTEYGYSIALTSSNEAIVIGNTNSPNFPVTAGVVQSAYGGGSNDVFVSKLNTVGSALIYSTYLGGSGTDDLTWLGDGLAVNTTGEAFITGLTESANFPVTAGAFDNTYNAGAGLSDGFVTKLNASGTAFVYSTYLGGTDNDKGSGIAIDAAGAAYIVGSTGSINFPVTVGVAQPVLGGGFKDVFVSKLNPIGSTLIYSTYVGGFSLEEGFSIALNKLNEAFVVGETQSADFPVSVGAYNVIFPASTPLSAKTAFVFRLNTTGSSIIYSTFLGHVSANGVAVNTNDEAYVTGYTSQFGDYPTTPCAFNNSFNGGGSDFFLSKLNSTGSLLLYSTYIGGNNSDYSSIKPVLRATGCGDDEVVMCGTSHSANFPTTTGVIQPSKLNGINDQPVIFKFKPVVSPDFSFSASPNCNTPVQFTDLSSGNCVWKAGQWTPTSWQWNFGDGTTSNVQNPLHVYTSGGTYNVKLVIGCPADSIIIPVTVTSSSCCTSTLNPSVNVTDAKCSANNGSGSVTVTGGTSPYSYSWSPSGGTGTTATGLAPGSYNVLITDGLNCKTAVNLTVNNMQMSIVTGAQSYLCNGSSNGTTSVSVAGPGTPPYTYNWSHGQTSQVATGLSAGSYTVTVNDATGCSLSTILTITEASPISVTVTPVNGTCGNPGTISTTAIGGAGSSTASYTYLWSNGRIGSNATGFNAGTYTVTVADGAGCTASKTASITVAPNPAVATFNQSPAGTVCMGTPVNFINTGTTGTYFWVISPITPVNVSGTTVDFSYTFLNTGTYTISHTVNNGGCSANVISNITVINCTAGPTVTATGSSICSGSCGTVTSNGAAGSSPYTYSWSNGATTQNISPCPVLTTTYTVTIKDTGGNASTSSAVVVVNPAVSVTTTVNNITCSGGTNGSVLASPGSGTSPYSYSWSTGATTSQISNLVSQTYTVTITDSKSCTGTSTAVIISPSPLVGQFTKGTASCIACGCKEWIIATATGGTAPYTYVWPDGYSNRFKNSLCPGIYSINIKDKNGCSININIAAP